MSDSKKIEELEERIEKLEKIVTYLLGGRVNDKMREQMGLSKCPF
jgi:hypothetical protein